MALFHSCSQFIAESGGPHILNECLVLAKGSAKSFQTGKNYKRCKHMHEILALAIEKLKFELFLETYENTEDIRSLVIPELQITKEQKHLDKHVWSQEIEELLAAYKSYTVESSDGKRSKSTDHWKNYVSMIHLYHEFSRSIHTGDLDLFISSLPKITSYFFTFNEPNYARWTVKYHDNLLKLPETHPEVYLEFKNKLFEIKRTPKSFSRSPIGLVVEKTINVNAAWQRTGVSALTNSISTRQRWAESNFCKQL